MGGSEHTGVAYRQKPARAARAPAGEFVRAERSAAEPWLWGLCIFLLTSPFAYQLTGLDPAVQTVRDAATMRRTVGSGMPIYLLRYMIMMIAVASIALNWKAAVAQLRRMATVLCFLGWSILSLLWTDSFSSSLNGILALLPLLVTGFCLALRLPPVLFARSFVLSGVFVVVFSLIWVFLLPHFGVHQVTDASQSVHAGAWRGVYPHKNLLGGVLAAGAVMVLLSGRAILPSAILRWSLFAAQCFMIIKTSSATSIVIVLVAPAVAFFVVRMSGAQRIVAVLIIAPLVLLMVTQLDAILGFFGRDATFTGRTDIWKYAPDAIAQSPLLGYGFASTTYGGYMLDLYKRFGLFDPHNGYLNMLLGTGLIGLVLFMATIISAATTARQMFLGRPEVRQAAYVIFGIIATWLVAMGSESQDKPLGSFAALGYTALGCLVYRQKLTPATPRALNRIKQ